jgi:hypothetical protein
MCRSFGLLLAATVVVSACGGSSASNKAPGQSQAAVATMPCGSGMWHGMVAYTWCGPARATVTYGDKTYVLSGLCQLGPRRDLVARDFTANFGTTIIGVGGADLPGAPDGLDVAFMAGEDYVSGRFDGHLWGIESSETSLQIAADKQSGSFSGGTLDGVQVEGHFTCTNP